MTTGIDRPLDHSSIEVFVNARVETAILTARKCEPNNFVGVI